MKKVLFTFLICVLSLQMTIAQTPSVDHWETIIYSFHIWNYFVGHSEPDINWRKLEFNNSLWKKGIGGIGYGDGDDRTIIDPTMSLYLRIKFSIVDTAKIDKAIFNMDYDDAFVAYLNEVEIARSNIGVVGDHPLHDQPAITNREAQMYQGGEPEYFVLEKDKLNSCLLEGNNILAIQVHNSSMTSSDLSAIPFFSVGITDTSLTYHPTPDWFQPPLIFSSSNLPIVIINTNGQTILDEPKILADMKIIRNPDGARNNVTDSLYDYHGKISIELRGSSTLYFPKQSYGFETQAETGENLNISLLGMPAENDWILYGPYSDKSLLRNVLCFHLAHKMGQYASRTKFCELVLNGDYQGIYVLMEKIKRDKNRVDIAKLTPDEISGDDVTGGYIIKVDKEEGEFRGWTSYSNPPNGNWKPIFFQYYYPKIDEIVLEQEKYIQNFILNFESALNRIDFKNPKTGYTKYINVGSFVDHLIMKELTKEIDSYRFSTFMYKDKNSNDGRLTMGPVWDFNLGFGNVNYGDERAMFTNGWMYDKWGRMYWWARMMQDENFRNKLKARWIELRRGPFHTDSIGVFLDKMSAYIDEAQKRNFIRWCILGKYVWPNYYIGDSYQDELAYLKNWIIDRLNWLDNNMPGVYSSTSTELDRDMSNPVDFQIFPNPFSFSTHIRYDLESSSLVSVKIFDILGRKVQTLINTVQPKGSHIVAWDGKDELGNPVANGLFFFSIKFDGKIAASGKIIKQ